MLFNNLTTGLFLAAALGELLAPEVFTPVAKAAYPIALVLLLADLVCLVLDLGDPLRFHHMLRVFKPTSPMSLGTWCLTVYSLPLTVAAALSLLPGGGPPWSGSARRPWSSALLPALGSALYKGVLLSTNAQPGWHDARWLGGYLTNSALLLGCAEMLALGRAPGAREGDGRSPARPRAAARAQRARPCSCCSPNCGRRLRGSTRRSSLWQHGNAHTRRRVLVPLCLILVGGSPALLLAAVLFVLLGSLAIRFVIVKVPHALTGCSKQRPPVGFRGWGTRPFGFRWWLAAKCTVAVGARPTAGTATPSG